MSLLLIFAHPDDESFFTAGISRQAAEAGVPVVLCCATRGQRGKPGNPPLTTIEELPAFREREMREAAAILGIGEVEFLSYQDKQLAEAPPAEIRASLVGLIRRHRPSIVITFEPNGANQHPDHVAISRFTTEAVNAAADARWLPHLGPAWRVPRLLWVGTINPWDETDPARLAAHPGVDFLIDIRPWREIKARALKTHRTQHQSINRLFFDPPESDAILSFETFRLAAGTPPAAVPADDLFSGLQIDTRPPR